MKNGFLIPALTLLLFIMPSNTNSQTVPTVAEVHNFFNGKQKLITYREGEVLYGTYYFLEVHYCPNGGYGLYASTVKRTVLDNEQRNSWQDFGTWKVVEMNGLVGMQTTGSQGPQFIPIYKLANGDFFIREGLSIVNQGDAICP